jgi:hypothetical protein
VCVVPVPVGVVVLVIVIVFVVSVVGVVGDMAVDIMVEHRSDAWYVSKFLLPFNLLTLDS